MVIVFALKDKYNYIFGSFPMTSLRNSTMAFHLYRDIDRTAELTHAIIHSCRPLGSSISGFNQILGMWNMHFGKALSILMLL